jgi:hypothetical protein
LTTKQMLAMAATSRDERIAGRLLIRALKILGSGYAVTHRSSKEIIEEIRKGPHGPRRGPSCVADMAHAATNFHSEMCPMRSTGNIWRRNKVERNDFSARATRAKRDRRAPEAEKQRVSARFKIVESVESVRPVVKATGKS